MILKQAWIERDKWNKDYIIPSYDRDRVKAETAKAPVWLHFGAGNIFRAFMAAAMDRLLEKGLSDKGIIVCEDFDKELVHLAYEPYDCLSLLVTLKADGSVEKRVVGSVTEAVVDEERMKELFSLASVQMVSFTITEKGYSGPLMGKIARLCLERYRQGAHPIALVSMDNCAHNGDLLKEAVLKHARELLAEGQADTGFIDYLTDESRVSFPWSMIDKITPRPDEAVKKLLEEDGFEDSQLIITNRGSYTAAFVNAEETEYLIIEDKFPNGRPKLEAAGILFTDRQTVDRVEKMKVGTCLNPLHTALAVFGCLLGYRTIHDEMEDELLRKMVYRLGYKEGMPVVVDPGIIKPEEFLSDVLTKRLPNPFMPDAPQRIATDTSQKLPVRFGQTLKAYAESDGLDINGLVVIPLVFAGWIRYLTGVNDKGEVFELSPDPRLEELCAHLSSVRPGEYPADLSVVDPILRDRSIFVVDLFECGLAEKVKAMLKEMLAGCGAVRRTLEKYLCED